MAQINISNTSIYNLFQKFQIIVSNFAFRVLLFLLHPCFIVLCFFKFLLWLNVGCFHIADVIDRHIIAIFEIFIIGHINEQIIVLRIMILIANHKNLIWSKIELRINQIIVSIEGRFSNPFYLPLGRVANLVICENIRKL